MKTTKQAQKELCYIIVPDSGRFRVLAAFTKHKLARETLFNIGSTGRTPETKYRTHENRAVFWTPALPEQCEFINHDDTPERPGGFYPLKLMPGVSARFAEAVKEFYELQKQQLKIKGMKRGQKL